MSYRCHYCRAHVDGPMHRHVVTREITPQLAVVRGEPVYGKPRIEIAAELPVCGPCLRKLRGEAPLPAQAKRVPPPTPSVEPEYQEPKFGD